MILSQYASVENEETPWTVSKTATEFIKVDKHINTLIYTEGYICVWEESEVNTVRTSKLHTHQIQNPALTRG